MLLKWSGNQLKMLYQEFLAGETGRQAIIFDMATGKQPNICLNPLKLPFSQNKYQLVVSIVAMETAEVLSGDGSRSFFKVQSYKFLK